MKARVIVSGIMAVIIAFAGTAEAQTRKNFLTLYDGAHYHLSSGETEEYALGENDFPVVPAHLGFQFGLSYLRLGKKLGWEVDARYIGSSSVDLVDPSDGDTLQVTTGLHASLTVNVLYAPFSGMVRPYLLTGGGMDAYLSGDASYTSSFGYIIDVPAPELKDRFDPEAHVGIGILITIGKSWGGRLESRFGWIFEGSETLSGISGAVGIFLSF